MPRPMLLDLSRLHGQREHVERTFQPSAFEPQDEDYRVATPVELSMDIEKAGAGVFRVTGRAVTRLELECGRCLDEFEVPVERGSKELRLDDFVVTEAMGFARGTSYEISIEAAPEEGAAAGETKKAGKADVYAKGVITLR